MVSSSTNDYRRGECADLGEHDTYRIKITSASGETKWLSITAHEFRGVRSMLTAPSTLPNAAPATHTPHPSGRVRYSSPDQVGIQLEDDRFVLVTGSGHVTILNDAADHASGFIVPAGMEEAEAHKDYPVRMYRLG